MSEIACVNSYMVINGRKFAVGSDSVQDPPIVVYRDGKCRMAGQGDKMEDWMFDSKMLKAKLVDMRRRMKNEKI